MCISWRVRYIIVYASSVCPRTGSNVCFIAYVSLYLLLLLCVRANGYGYILRISEKRQLIFSSRTFPIPISLAHSGVHCVLCYITRNQLFHSIDFMFIIWSMWFYLLLIKIVYFIWIEPQRMWMFSTKPNWRALHPSNSRIENVQRKREGKWKKIAINRIHIIITSIRLHFKLHQKKISHCRCRFRGGEHLYEKRFDSSNFWK